MSRIVESATDPGATGQKIIDDKLCRIKVVYVVYCSGREGATMQDEPQREWLTVDEVATLFRINSETVRRWIRAGALPALNLGGLRSGYRIKRSDLDTFITSHYSATGKAAG
jgi:excisionase family DNA binding protein